MSRLVRIASLLSLAACTVKYAQPAPQPRPVYVQAAPQPQAAPVATRTAAVPSAANGSAAPTAERIVDENGNTIVVQQGARGEPTLVGCSDGQREGLIDASRYPRIAGCLGQWSGTQSLRSQSTGRACGDDSGSCANPADLCATGWHVCGSNGLIAEVAQLSADECFHAGGARFSAALSHCENQDGCNYDRPDGNADGRYACFESGWCSEAVCCGESCGDFGACTDGVWPGATHIAQGMDQGCGAMTSLRAGGVLCCK